MVWRSWESVWPMHWCKAYVDRKPKLGRSSMQAGEKAYSKFGLLKWFAGNIRDHFYSELWLELIMLQSVQSLSCVRFFATPWIAARQAFLSITNSWSSLKFMSIESVMPSSHLIFCRPLLLLTPIPPSIRVFPMSQLFTSGSKSIGVSASTLVLPMNTQDWSSFGWTGWISLQSKGLSRVFSNTTVQKHQFFGAQLSL